MGAPAAEEQSKRKFPLLISPLFPPLLLLFEVILKPSRRKRRNSVKLFATQKETNIDDSERFDSVSLLQQQK